MRKFILIKEFPLSPSLGTEVVFETDAHFNDGINNIGAIGTLMFEDCLKYPEFWKEIRDKHYSIPIYWESYKRYDVVAENLQEACEKAVKIFLSEPDPLYVDDSFNIDTYIEEETGEVFDMDLMGEKL